ncbi:MAG: hypothetical protein U1F87_09585 [Kiritimatiellia bacterium]
MNDKTLCLALLCLLSAGCGTPSNDPREGGLIGYWATGTSGYEGRLEQKKKALEQERAAAEAAKASAGLESRKEERAQQLAAQEKELARIAADVGALEAQLREVSRLGGEKAAERDRLLGSLASLQGQVKAAQGNPDEEAAKRRPGSRNLTVRTRPCARRRRCSLASNRLLFAGLALLPAWIASAAPEPERWTDDDSMLAFSEPPARSAPAPSRPIPWRTSPGPP